MVKALYFVIRWLIIISNSHARFMDKLLFKTRYKLCGSCVQCGKCCEVLGILDTELKKRNKYLTKLVIAFYENVYNLKLLGFNEPESILLFTCKKLNRKEGKCGDYFNRPALCRNYPFVRYFEKPDIFPQCGYWVELRDKR
ncbi:YkgJ family cysteine cluster protein [Candidatus Margulisiibacteriota bacterium]